jgi:hypothetical protein
MQELEWMSAHSEEVERYSGKWVAVNERGVVAAGNSVSEVEALLKKKGIAWEKVLLTKVPRKDEEMSIL